jgi:hypothetical protein
MDNDGKNKKGTIAAWLVAALIGIGLLIYAFYDKIFGPPTIEDLKDPRSAFDPNAPRGPERGPQPGIPPDVRRVSPDATNPSRPSHLRVNPLDSEDKGG